MARYLTHVPALNTWPYMGEVTNRLNGLFSRPNTEAPGSWLPPVNVEETPEALILTAELPGLAPEDVEVGLENGVLTLSGEKRSGRSEEDEDSRYHVWERSDGRFRRTFTIPRGVVGSDVEAVFKAGVLSVRLPKAPEAKGRTIEIRTES